MRLRITTVALIVAIVAPTARATSVNLATGLDAAGNLITSGGVNDVNWTVTPDPTYSPTGIPQTVFPNNADWFGDWASNGPNSDWIARDANVTNNGPAPYSFYRTFTLTAAELSSATIIGGAWAIDDSGTLSLNGNTLSTLGTGAWGGLTSFSATTSDFVVGANTLAITMTYDDEYLEAVRLQGTLSFNGSSVPEPSTLAMGTAALAIGAVMVRRPRRS